MRRWIGWCGVAMLGATAVLIGLPFAERKMDQVGEIQVKPVPNMDHALAPAEPQAVAVAVNAQHGAFVANMCGGCHGDRLSGGKIPGAPPDWPAAPNLTPGATAMARYRGVEAFVTMLRTGKRPDGSTITFMPFESLAKINDVEALAIYDYLRTVPARPFAQR